MKLRVKLLILFCFLNFASISLLAQKLVLKTATEVDSAVGKEMEKFLNQPSFRHTLKTKFPQVAGFVKVHLGINDKGKIISFFKVDSDIEGLDFIEFLAHKLLDYQFNFKLQKNKRFKIEQLLLI